MDVIVHILAWKSYDLCLNRCLQFKLTRYTSVVRVSLQNFCATSKADVTASDQRQVTPECLCHFSILVSYCVMYELCCILTLVILRDVVFLVIRLN